MRLKITILVAIAATLLSLQGNVYSTWLYGYSCAMRNVRLDNGGTSNQRCCCDTYRWASQIWGEAATWRTWVYKPRGECKGWHAELDPNANRNSEPQRICHNACCNLGGQPAPDPTGRS